jgi:hypothetical protein
MQTVIIIISLFLILLATATYSSSTDKSTAILTIITIIFAAISADISAKSTETTRKQAEQSLALSEKIAQDNHDQTERAFKQSEKIARKTYEQLEREYKTSVTPVLIFDEIKTYGGARYPISDLSHRKLHVFCDIKNIGDSPAIQVYTKVGLKFKFVEGDYSNYLSEYYYAGSLATNDKCKSTMSLDDAKLFLLLEDISMMLKDNVSKVERGESLTKGATLVISCVYSNIHRQYFKTIYEIGIYGITVVEGEKRIRTMMLSDIPKLGDNEQFELICINSSLSHLEIKLLSDVEANEFIDEYKDLINVC